MDLFQNVIESSRCYFDFTDQKERFFSLLYAKMIVIGSDANKSVLSVIAM
jgi:hypothetical protein